MDFRNSASGLIRILLTLAIGSLAWMYSQAFASTQAAWITLICLYAFLLQGGLELTRGRRLWVILITGILLSALAGFSAAGLEQIENRFSEEEFFSAIKALMLGIYWGILYASFHLVRHFLAKPSDPTPAPVGYSVTIFLVVFSLAAGLAVVSAYQNSFFPSQAPDYPGISQEKPFICGRAPADAKKYSGEGVFQQLLALIEANPDKSTPEFGMLALATTEPRWMDEFRRLLLAEMQTGQFTTPANSVKYSQYEAALRIYYYTRINQRAPGLFTPNEKKAIQGWFAAVNRRAWSVEWIDWLYALAFRIRPTGIFKNQEIGAGLLALLETNGFADAQLSRQNRAYLSAQPRGWQARFRNSDDAIDYQQEWIYNALFQSWYSGQPPPQAAAHRSFEWLWLQALPDGSPLQVNHPVPLVQTGIAYLGAHLTQDPHLLWISGRSLEYFNSVAGEQTAVPGLDGPVDLDGVSPQVGSCLMYGDSGLPTRQGPLAPDKIVFRDGWRGDSGYMLVNLRFSGWHRYKGSATVTTVYQSGQLAGEILQGEPFAWLPQGRSQFRDKRIPRQNLNGLQVEISGMSAVLYSLTRLGSPWAQDPPYYARVQNFETGESFDQATILLDGWRGWSQIRSIYFYHQGPVLVLDQAKGPPGRKAAITWQLPREALKLGDRLRLRSGENPAELLLIPLHESANLPVDAQPSPTQSYFQVQYPSNRAGSLALLSVFLTREWVGSSWSLQPAPGGWELTITQGFRQIAIVLPDLMR